MSKSDWFFIETLEGESVEDWRHAVEGMISTVMPVPPNWHYPYADGPTIAFCGRRYRSFRTVFGAVIASLLQEGHRRLLPRAMLVILGGKPSPTAAIIADGKEWEADPTEALDQLANARNAASEDRGRDQI